MHFPFPMVLLSITLCFFDGLLVLKDGESCSWLNMNLDSQAV